jgi:zinc protease
MPDHTAGYVFFRVIFRGGSLLDPPGSPGLMVLAANAVLLGTRRRSRAEFLDALDELGASLDVAVYREQVAFEGEVLTRHLPAFVELLAEALAEPAFDPGEVERLARRTAAELEQVADSDEALVALAHHDHVFRGSAFARQTRGLPHTVVHVTAAQLREIWTQSISRTTAVVASAGDLTLEETERYGRIALAGVGSAEVEIPAPPMPVLPAGLSILLVDKPDRTQTQVAWGHPCIPANHPDLLALSVANTALGGTFTARLMHEIREKRGWSYGAYSRISSDAIVGSFSARYYPATKDTLPALELGRQLLTDFAANGMRDEELEFTRSYLENSFPFVVETAAKRLTAQLEVEATGRPHDYLETYLDKLAQVTLAEANAAARAHIHPHALALTIVCTASDLEPALRAWPGVRELTVVPYDALWQAVEQG